jgi:hypothetical protein
MAFAPIDYGYHAVGIILKAVFDTHPFRWLALCCVSAASIKPTFRSHDSEADSWFMSGIAGTSGWSSFQGCSVACTSMLVK